jgi:hypothetical protein
MEILEQIQKIVETRNVATILSKESKATPYPHLLVPFEKHIMEITEHPTFQGQLLPNANKNPQEQQYYLIQFQFVLLDKVPAETFNQTSSALHFFNRLLHCPGFELDQINDIVTYRYCWFMKKSELDSFLFLQVFDNVLLAFQMFSPYVENIIQGKYTLENIIQEMLDQQNKNG